MENWVKEILLYYLDTRKHQIECRIINTNNNEYQEELIKSIDDVNHAITIVKSL